MKRILIFLSLIVLCGYQLAYANISANDILELNNATPGTSKVGLGTVLSAEQASIDTNTANITTLQADVLTAQNTADTAFARVDSLSLLFLTTGDTSITNTTDLAYVRKFTGRENEGVILGSGDALQIITFALTFANGGGDFAITPDTSSGFSQVNLVATGDNATLRYVDTEIGWTLIGLGTSDTGKVVTSLNPYN